MYEARAVSGSSTVQIGSPASLETSRLFEAKRREELNRRPPRIAENQIKIPRSENLKLQSRRLRQHIVLNALDDNGQ